MKRLIFMALAATTTACTSLNAPAPRTAAPAPAADNRAAAPQDTQAQTLTGLLGEARDARLAGRLGDAESLLESALRIAPGDARLWLELAEVQFAAGEFDAARGLAERALTLSDNDANVVEAAQRLIAQTSG